MFFYLLFLYMFQSFHTYINEKCATDEASPSKINLLNTLNIIPNKGIIKTYNIQQNLQLKSKVLQRWS